MNCEQKKLDIWQTVKVLSVNFPIKCHACYSSPTKGKFIACTPSSKATKCAQPQIERGIVGFIWNCAASAGRHAINFHGD